MTLFNNEFIYVYFKRGDQKTSLSRHKNLCYYDSMIVKIFDPEDSTVKNTVVITDKKTSEKNTYIINKNSDEIPLAEREDSDIKIEVFNSQAISEKSKEIFFIVKFNRSRKQDLLEYSQEYFTSLNFKGEPSIDDDYRKSKKYIDWNIVEANTGIENLESIVHSPEKIEIIDGEANNIIECLKDSKNFDFSSREYIQDFRAISSGTHTVGTDVSDDYADFNEAWSDLSNLTNDLTLIVTSNFTESNFSSIDIDLNGYVLTLTSNSYHYGTSQRGHLISCNRDGNLYALRCDGPGELRIKNLSFKQTASTTSTWRLMYFINNGASTSYSAFLNNLLFDGNNESVGFLRVYDSLPVIRAWNIKAWDGEGIELNDCNSSNIFENITVKDSNYGIDANGQNIKIQNCLCDGNTPDFQNTGSATGNNNASSDSSAGNGNWNSGSNNETSINDSNEFLSTTSASYSYLRLSENGVCYDGGISPSISDNVRGIRNNLKESLYSIGADEYSEIETVRYSVGTSVLDLKTGSPTIDIIDGVATFSTAQTGNIGVGDEIDYGSNNKKCYISQKKSSNEWVVIDFLGLPPTGAASETVNSIKRVFNSLSDALDGTSNGVIDLLGSGNLVDLNLRVFVSCFKDSSDVTNITVDGFEDGFNTPWCDETRYIKIYSPWNTNTEVNTCQCHDGTPGTGYILDSSSSGTDAIEYAVGLRNLQIIGIEIKGAGGSVSTDYGVKADISSGVVTNCIIHGFERAISLGRIKWENFTIFNTVCYDYLYGVYSSATSNSGNFYYAFCNFISTVANSIGITQDSNNHFHLVSNCILENDSKDFDSDEISNQIHVWQSIFSEAEQASGNGIKYVFGNSSSTTLTFKDKANFDFNLVSSDTDAIGQGQVLMLKNNVIDSEVTSKTTNKLIDTTQNFTSDLIGRAVCMDTYGRADVAEVTALDSSTQLSLSDDIFDNSGDYNYILNPETYRFDFGAEDIKHTDRGQSVSSWDIGAFKFVGVSDYSWNALMP